MRQQERRVKGERRGKEEGKGGKGGRVKRVEISRRSSVVVDACARASERRESESHVHCNLRLAVLFSVGHNALRSTYVY